MNATLSVPFDERIVKLFAAEDKAFNRAEYALQKENDALVFHVKASDATAMRAALSAITKVLSVHESTLHYGGAGKKHD